MDLLTLDEQETIIEAGTMFREAAVTVLSTFLNREVSLSFPRVGVLPASRVRAAFPQSCLVVPLHYRAGLQGENVFLLKEEVACAIAAMLTGSPVETLTEDPEDLAWSALQEIFNQIAGHMATAMSDLFKTPIEISPPALNLHQPTDDAICFLSLEEEDPVIQVSFTLQAETVPDSTLIQVMPLPFARSMVGLRQGKPAEDPGQKPAGQAEAEQNIDSGEGHICPDVFDQASLQSHTADLANSDLAGIGSDDLEKLSLLKDIPVSVTVILGKTSISLGKLFSLGRGGVIDLNCIDGEPVKVLINNKPVAWGEIVAVNDELAVRITSLQPGLAENKNGTKFG